MGWGGGEIGGGGEGKRIRGGEGGGKGSLGPRGRVDAQFRQSRLKKGRTRAPIQATAFVLPSHVEPAFNNASVNK